MRKPRSHGSATFLVLLLSPAEGSCVEASEMAPEGKCSFKNCLVRYNSVSSYPPLLNG